MQVNGTDDKWTLIRLTRVELGDGQYEIGLSGMTDDMKIEHIEFRDIE